MRGAGNRGRCLLPLSRVAVTRELPKLGFKLVLLIPARWNSDMFAGVCLGCGCPFDLARKIARELGAAGDRLVTVRPLPDREKFVAACEALGVHVEEIPPL